MKSPLLYCEFARASVKTLAGGNHAEFPLERAADGSLTIACRDRLVPALKQFLRAGGAPSPAPAWCAIDARGVSLRCLLLPAVAGPAWPQLVRIQIESDFPLPPDELAWGFQLRGNPQPQADGTQKQAVLVAAVKKDLLEQYAEILTAAGASPVFTLSALARAALCPPVASGFAVLEPGPGQSELIGFEGDARAFVRLLPPVAGSGEASWEAVAKAVEAHWRGPKLYVLGDADTAAQIIRRLPSGLAAEVMAGASSDGSTAIQGLKKIAAEQGGLPLALHIKPAAPAVKIAEPALVQWGLRAAILLVVVLLFPTLEAMIFTTPLAKTVGAFEANATNVEATVDHDLAFLQTLKQTQPPYLESLYLIAKAAPPGIHIESLTLNRRGEMSLRGSLRNGDQVADFRSQLIASGYFASVTVEEQTPGQQKVNIRMTGQWKPLAQLQVVSVGPAASELGTNGAAAPAAGGAPPAFGGMPGQLNGGGN